MTAGHCFIHIINMHAPDAAGCGEMWEKAWGHAGGGILPQGQKHCMPPVMAYYPTAVAYDHFTNMVDNFANNHNRLVNNI